MLYSYSELIKIAGWEAAADNSTADATSNTKEKKHSWQGLQEKVKSWWDKQDKDSLTGIGAGAAGGLFLGYALERLLNQKKKRSWLRSLLYSGIGAAALGGAAYHLNKPAPAEGADKKKQQEAESIDANSAKEESKNPLYNTLPEVDKVVAKAPGMKYLPDWAPRRVTDIGVASGGLLAGKMMFPLTDRFTLRTPLYKGVSTARKLFSGDPTGMFALTVLQDSAGKRTLAFVPGSSFKSKNVVNITDAMAPLVGIPAGTYASSTRSLFKQPKPSVPVQGSKIKQFTVNAGRKVKEGLTPAWSWLSTPYKKGVGSQIRDAVADGVEATGSARGIANALEESHSYGLGRLKHAPGVIQLGASLLGAVLTLAARGSKADVDSKFRSTQQ